MQHQHTKQTNPELPLQIVPNKNYQRKKNLPGVWITGGEDEQHRFNDCWVLHGCQWNPKGSTTVGSNVSRWKTETTLGSGDGLRGCLGWTSGVFGWPSGVFGIKDLDGTLGWSSPIVFSVHGVIILRLYSGELTGTVCKNSSLQNKVIWNQLLGRVQVGFLGGKVLLFISQVSIPWRYWYCTPCHVFTVPWISMTFQASLTSLKKIVSNINQNCQSTSTSEFPIYFNNKWTHPSKTWACARVKVNQLLSCLHLGLPSWKNRRRWLAWALHCTVASEDATSGTSCSRKNSWFQLSCLLSWRQDRTFVPSCAFRLVRSEIYQVSRLIIRYSLFCNLGL